LEQLAELLIETAPGSEVAALPTQDNTPVTHAGVLLPVIVNGHPVLLPLDADTVAASGLGAYLGELRAAGYHSGSVATAGEWEAMSPLSRRSLLTHGIAAAALPGLGLDELQRVASAMDDASPPLSRWPGDRVLPPPAHHVQSRRRQPGAGCPWCWASSGRSKNMLVPSRQMCAVRC
jgi:hypothetical protein